ncbi:hypothetical protein MEME101129_22005 [Methylobacterium mesophilicum]|uniref:hypothetical protein n=1 Tax=Methylobacterium mesophilicum TaxID=39956 RepID=UPI0036228768
MRISPFTKQGLRTAAAHITSFSSDAPSKEAFASYMEAVTAFSVLESDFVPVGQTDSRLRDDVRSHLKAEPIAPVADLFRRLITRRGPVGSIEYEDRPWQMLGAMETVDEVAAALGTLHARWLRVTAYSALIAYGTAGAMLPEAPDGLAINVGLVPFDKPGRRFVDEDDDEGADVPVTVLKRR